MLVLVGLCPLLYVKSALLYWMICLSSSHNTQHPPHTVAAYLPLRLHSCTSSTGDWLKCTCRPHGYRGQRVHSEDKVSLQLNRSNWFVFSSRTLLLNCESTNCSLWSLAVAVSFLANWYNTHTDQCLGWQCWINSRTDNSQEQQQHLSTAENTCMRGTPLNQVTASSQFIPQHPHNDILLLCERSEKLSLCQPLCHWEHS